MEVTLKDIAKEARVSISTVSRVLNQNSGALNETQKRILATAKSMGYSDKKVIAMSHVDRLSCTLGCIFTSEHESIVSPFFSELHKGIQMEAKRLSSFMDIQLITTSVNGADSRGLTKKTNLDGAIILGRTQKETIDAIRQAIPHCVYAGLNPIPGIDNVISDVKEGIQDIVRYLYATGRRKIGFIGPVSSNPSTFNEYRYEAYAAATQELGLQVEKSFVRDSYLHASNGYDAALSLLEAGVKPDAIICGNDNLAIGVMKALATKKLRIPEDIALTGYDDIPDSAYLTPSLTTVDMPKTDLGRHALLLLVDAITSGRSYPISMRLPHTLVVRESTKEAPK